MIRRISEGEIDVGHEANHEVRLIDHRTDGFSSRSLWRHKRRSRSRLLARLVIWAGPGMAGWNEQRIFRMNAEWSSAGEHRMMAHAAQNFVGFGLVVVDALAVSPAMRSEVERHHEVLFAVWRRACRTRSAVGVHRPGEVSNRRILRVGDEHIGIGP